MEEERKMWGRIETDAVDRERWRMREKNGGGLRNMEEDRERWRWVLKGEIY